jgi:pyruvate/2-oxoglutarate/acetoin dehydrogenase E1 component
LATITYTEALNAAHHQAMQDDERVFLIGEDIGQYGGIYRVTEGLLDTFGKKRVRDTPISEAAITGAAIGAALVGCRPILEIGFVDFAGTCFDQITNQAAKFSYMSDGQVSVPLVFRMACGAGMGYGVHHSQSLEAWFTHVPGLKVVMPATPADAYGLLLSAIDDDNPVAFLEHKMLYSLKGEMPDDRPRVPIGKANVVREGDDITIVAWSRAVHWALAAAEEVAREGISCHVVDLRSLIPLDEATLFQAIEKTGRLIVCHEACQTGGFGAEIIARVVDNAFDALDAPPLRVCGPDTPVPNSLPLEAVYLNTETRLMDAVRNLAGANHPKSKKTRSSP